MTTDTNPKVGTIVLPMPDTTADESIVGIVVDDNYAMAMVDVVWISDQRGMFVCWEAVSDLVVAGLDERDIITDSKLDHEYVARILNTVPLG